MYYILEHRSLNDVTNAYSAKYPGQNVILARNALLFQGQIRKEAQLHMLLKPYNKKENDFRLRSAVLSPGQVFPKTVAPEKKIEDQRQSLGKGQKKKGKRL